VEDDVGSPSRVAALCSPTKHHVRGRGRCRQLVLYRQVRELLRRGDIWSIQHDTKEMPLILHTYREHHHLRNQPGLCSHTHYFFFFGFFFFTPPPPPVAPGTAVEAMASSGGVSNRSVWAELANVGFGLRFCIFCISEKFNASNLFKNTEEDVLNLRHVVLSVIFSTNFPPDALHFTQYRVWWGASA